MQTILIVEDHENIRHEIREKLVNEGYNVLESGTLEQGKSQLSKNLDLILLDWMLPDGQGLDLLTEIRRLGHQVPIIFLTARAELVDKVLGLELGANDYLTKPFEQRELLARIRVQLRGKESSKVIENEIQQIRLGQLSIDRIKHKVIFDGKLVELVKKEFDLLVLFSENPEKVFSREEILNKVWGYDVFPTTRTVDTHVLGLRQKIHPDLIETVRSVGYRLKSV